MIGTISSQNNMQIDVTGLLVFFEKLFYQIIEGDDKEIDQLFVKSQKIQDIMIS